MSQWGAYAMAKAGKTAEEIVMHYFRGVSIGPGVGISKRHIRSAKTDCAQKGGRAMRPLQRVVAFPDCRGLFARTIGFIRSSCFQALQRFIQHRLPLFKIHIRHIEGFQLVVELLGLRQRGACAMQVKLDARAPLLERTFMAQQRALRETGGKIEALFGGELFAGGDERGERGVVRCSSRPGTRGHRCSSTL